MLPPPVVAVMVCGEDVLMGSKVFGVAMAAAVLIDATVVRGVLLSTPAWRCSATGPGRCPARGAGRARREARRQRGRGRYRPERLE